MNETCDRCGPAVRAAYRASRGGQLYLCGHCAKPATADALHARLGHLAHRRVRTRAASQVANRTWLSDLFREDLPKISLSFQPARRGTRRGPVGVLRPTRGGAGRRV